MHRKDLLPSLLLSLCALVSLTTPAHAQSPNTNFFSSWQARVRATLARQPSFPIPVIAPSAQMVQLFRFDYLHEYAPARTSTDIFTNGKGLNLVPFANTEIDINLPTYIQHHNPKVHDGAGDFSTIIKFRPFASSDAHHDFSAAAQLAISVPTGSYKNGTAVSTLTPTLLAGKGFGPFVLQSTLGAILPTSATATIGRTVTWNTTAQLRLAKIFWPELEVNTNTYHQGPNDGKNQTFLSPGLMVSKINFRHTPNNRLAVTLGSGFQIATSTFHTYNHAYIFTSRFAF
ncbi:MAG: hypothetical protein WBY53_16685 [Acidobacteriaceae bacterium]